MSSQGENSLTEGQLFRKKLGLSMLLPVIFVIILWIVKITEILFNFDLTKLGIYPLALKGLSGIFLSPFIHADFIHLLNNSLPVLFLGTALFYFYSEIAVKIVLLTWLFTGFFVWLAGREGCHIGASGLVYGLASFLFFSGIIRKNFRLAGLSLLIVFLYGSMVWGIFPGTYRNISWESHMLGFFSGIILSIVYRKEGPQEPVYDWMDDESQDSEPVQEEDSEKQKINP